jgi:hypothetical protein
MSLSEDIFSMFSHSCMLRAAQAIPVFQRHFTRAPMIRRAMSPLAVLVLGLCLTQVAAAATKLPFRSRFESGTWDDWNGGPDATLRIVSDDATEGRNSARAVMTAGTGTDNYKDFVFGDSNRVLGTAVTVQNGLWLKFDSKFESGFRFGSSANLHKLVILNFEDENGRRRYQLIINARRADNQYFLEHLKWNADRSFNRAIPGLDQHLGTPANVRFGQWDRFKLFVRPNTPGQANGVVKMWINGELKVDRSNVAVREDTNYMPNKMILSNYAPDATTNGAQRWDNFYLGETDPDTGVRPNPPVLDSVQ